MSVSPSRPTQVLESGLLTGKYRRGQPIPADSRASECNWLSEPHDAIYDRLGTFQSEAVRAELTPAQYALKWVLDQPDITSCVVGAKRIDQIEALLSGCR